MRLNIGETIKTLRKEREITQEEFAEVLGVSCQSISRWENDLCYPDIELIPTIAEFFGISTDRLMGVDETKEAEAVSSYLEAFRKKSVKETLTSVSLLLARVSKSFPTTIRFLINLCMLFLFQVMTTVTYLNGKRIWKSMMMK